MPQTPNFDWELPDVGGDDDTWATIVNAAFDAIDEDLQAVKDTADAALTSAYAELLGNVTVNGSVSGTRQLDLSLERNFTLTLSGNTTFQFTNCPGGMVQFVVKVVQTGTPFTVSWPASVKWASPSSAVSTSAPVLDATANRYHVLRFTTLDGGTTWIGEVVALTFS